MVTVLVAPGGFALPAAASPLPGPVPGPVVRGFDPPDQPWLPGHRGVDLAAAVGSPVRAVAAGRVTMAGKVVDRGVVVVTLPDGRRLTHEPVEPAVRVGQWVAVGQVLGTVAGGHCPTGCLHWGLRRGQEYLDPLRAVPAGVRLLPTSRLPGPWAAAAAPTGPRVPTSAPPAAPAPGRLRFPPPVAGPVTSPYGMRTHPVTGRRRLHDGLDLGAACGTPVHSMAPGRVVESLHHRAWGHRVVVDHGVVAGARLRTTYNHLQRPGPPVGSPVAGGQVVGVVGSTGFSTGCHLHLGVERAGHLVDPLPFLLR